jgi:hypothetical protein
MKYHPHGSVLFCTFSLEEGLLFQSNPLCLVTLQSCLARAVSLCPVTISHFLAEANHVHMIFVVENPDDVPGFIRNFKVESAHMLNRVLGRTKRTVWCEGYDSPVVLTPMRALSAIAYLYANPAKDNLETSIDRYPGFSSWEMFCGGQTSALWKRLHRPQFRELPKNAHNLKGYSDESARLLAEAREVQTFTLHPNAWMEAFGFQDAESQRRINERLIQRVRTLEQRAARKREKLGKTVVGRERLMARPIDTLYRPKRKGMKTCCLSEKRGLRIQFITFFKKLMRQAREIRRQWRAGYTSLRYPPGLHPPSMPKLANVLVG